MTLARALTACWRNVWPFAVAITVTFPAGTLNTYATPSAAVAVAVELGPPPKLYLTAPPGGFVVTVAPASGVPLQFDTTTPIKPLPVVCDSPVAVPRMPNSRLVMTSTLVVSLAARGRGG